MRSGAATHPDRGTVRRFVRLPGTPRITSRFRDVVEIQAPHGVSRLEEGCEPDGIEGGRERLRETELERRSFVDPDGAPAGPLIGRVAPREEEGLAASQLLGHHETQVLDETVIEDEVVRADEEMSPLTPPRR